MMLASYTMHAAEYGTKLPWINNMFEGNKHISYSNIAKFLSTPPVV